VTTPVQTNGLGQVSGVTSDVEDVASLPYTGGMNAQLTAIAVMVAAFVGGIAHFYSRSRSVVEL